MMRRRRGFTLIEMMIVVAIIGVLAAIAIPNYLQYVLKAKQSEAVLVLGNIKTGQIAFSASFDCYATIPPTPAGLPGPSRRTWNPAAPFVGANPCTGAPLSFEDIAMRPSGGDVYHSYGCAAEILGVNGPSNNFTCNALGDLDGDLGFFELAYCTDTDQNGVGLPTTNGAPCPFPDQQVRLSVDRF